MVIFNELTNCLQCNKLFEISQNTNDKITITYWIFIDANNLKKVLCSKRCKEVFIAKNESS